MARAENMDELRFRHDEAGLLAGWLEALPLELAISGVGAPPGCSTRFAYEDAGYLLCLGIAEQVQP